MAHLSPCIVKVLNSKTSLVPAAIWSGSDLHLRVMIHKVWVTFLMQVMSNMISDYNFFL